MTLAWSFSAISVGRLTVEQQPKPVLGQVDDNGVLTLNVGTDASERKLLINEKNENVSISQVAGTQTIQISMFGEVREFENVTSILIANMDDGDDVVVIDDSVTTKVVVHFGEGNDSLTNFGSGIVMAYGDGGHDQLVGGSANDLLDGGLGQDVLRGGKGEDTTTGGGDMDAIIWEVGDGQDLNIDGGGVSLGHPVGASGARIILHLCKILQRTKAKQGMASLCIGGGQGGAMLLTNES